MHIADYDFIDFGASTGGSLDFAKRRLGGTNGLGVDLSPKKVETMLARGLDCMLGDITDLHLPDDCVRFVTISHVLEHLPDLSVVERAVDSALRLATDFVFIQGPWFDADAYLESAGLKLYWADWPRGHTCHVDTGDLRKVLDRRPVVDYFIAGRGVIADSAHPAVHPFDSPPNQHAYDPLIHPAKPHVRFERPVFEETICAIKLRADLPDWEGLPRVRGSVSMVVPPGSLSTTSLMLKSLSVSPRPSSPEAPTPDEIGGRTPTSTTDQTQSDAVNASAEERTARAEDPRLTQLHHRLLRVRRWSYLRYMHMREGFLLSEGVASVLCVGAGRGLAELALAVEFPDVRFHITDIEGDGTPHFGQAEQLAAAWKLPNVTFGVRDILRPAARAHDMLISVEVLEHIEDDARASAEMRAAVRSCVFTLVPFATAEANAQKHLRSRVLKSHGHYRLGYDESDLRKLFPEVAAVRGCYWSDAGAGLRRRLQDFTDEQISDVVAELVDEAKSDVKDGVPLRDDEAQGIWALTKL